MDERDGERKRGKIREEKMQTEFESQKARRDKKQIKKSR